MNYHPEHWLEERWPQYVRLMAEAGLNVARLAEFVWFKMALDSSATRRFDAIG